MNYIRVNTLSWNSIEIYALLFLLLVFFRILVLQKDRHIDRQLIKMYILSSFFTDTTYRTVASIQIPELIIILAVMLDIYRNKLKIVKNSLTVFMLSLSGIFFSSDIIAPIQSIYTDSPYNSNASFLYAFGNNIKFLLIIYMVSKIIREIQSPNYLQELLKWGGGINSCVTILQVLMYKAGFRVPGIFDMWGIPRAKGLSHEPATNAFVLLLPMLLSLFYVYKGKYKIHGKLLLLHLTAFILCFSTGAIPIFLAAVSLFLLKSHRMIERSRRFAVNMTIATTILLAGILLFSIDISALISLIRKLLALFSDYVYNTNSSGRGSDAELLAVIMEHNFIVGIGAFNTLSIAGEILGSEAAVTNTYVIFLCELGILGFAAWLFVSLLFVHNYKIRLKAMRNKPYYANLFAYSAMIPVMLAWLRIFFFHQIWIALSFVYLKGNQACEK